jgi:ubiquinone/menaquinone biosynthesis C-methylase UbiE
VSGFKQQGGSPEAEYLATGFRNVDGAAFAKLQQCLSFLDTLPSFREYKRDVLAALEVHPGDTVADLGCGLGYDVQRLSDLVGPGGRAVGLDSSSALLRRARELAAEHPSAEFAEADIHCLPLRDALLHACKIDRTLQHVSDPERVIAEAFRVLRPGGRLVCSEPDWATLTIDHPDRAMTQQITQFWAESFRHPWIGRQVLNMARAAGFRNERVEGKLLIATSFDDSDRVFDFRETAQRIAQTDKQDAALRWIEQAQKRDRVLPVWSSVTLIITSATKPS